MPTPSTEPLPVSALDAPLTISGKQFRAGGGPVFVKAVTFGPFPEDAFPDGEWSQLGRIREELGANALRLYEVPSVDFLHACAENGLRVFLGIPWAQHVDFFSGREALVAGERTLVETVRAFRGHPAVAGYFVGNEIDKTLVRWMGPEKVRDEMERWIALGRANDPGALFAYANYPSTEYLLPRNQDFVAFNVYLEEREAFGSYLDRLQNLAGDKPLLLSEFGVDSVAHGAEGQGEILRWHVEECCRAGAAGTTVFAWSDLWRRGGKTVTGWEFGLTDRDGEAKPGLAALREAWEGLKGPADGLGRGWRRLGERECDPGAPRGLGASASSPAPEPIRELGRAVEKEKDKENEKELQLLEADSVEQEQEQEQEPPTTAPEGAEEISAGWSDRPAVARQVRRSLGVGGRAKEGAEPRGEQKSSRWPLVSVIVCTYRGSTTLAGCLRSLAELDYPEYEVLVVNDANDPRTAEIVNEVGGMRHIGIEHGGLGRARNVGAAEARGEVFAYTDDDCIVPPDWLFWIVSALERSEDIACAGGPNIPPPPVNARQARIAAAPGAPSHVLLDDTAAEHVPGCNLAVTRAAFEEIGGFDARFRTAGDDVDFCWRLSEAGHGIAFHAAAFVWHLRRSSYRAYLRQQVGYGRAEALLMPLHLERFRHFWGVEWKGAVYERAPSFAGVVYHGRYGQEPFQFLYAGEESGVAFLFLHASWWLMALLLAGGGFFFWPLWAVAGAMVATSLITAAKRAAGVYLPLPHSGRSSRAILALLVLLQGIARSYARVREGWKLTAWGRSFRRMGVELGRELIRVRWGRGKELRFWSEEGVGREEWLETMLAEEPAGRWRVDESGEVDLVATRWGEVESGLITVTEYHEGGKALTRVRKGFRWSRLFLILLGAWLLSSPFYVASQESDPLWGVLGASGVVVAILLFYGFGLWRFLLRDRRRILRCAEAVGMRRVR